MTPRRATTCEWFALCDNPATNIVSHPILGPLRVCDTCVVKLALDTETVQLEIDVTS